MTRFVSEQCDCAACGHRQQVEVLLSTSSFGSDTLEAQRGGHAGWALTRTVQECENCGYCSPDISELPGDIDRASAPRTELPIPKSWADRWLAWSEVAETAGELSEAGWAALHGAWAADPADSGEGARSLRIRAARLFQECRRRGHAYGRDRTFEISLVANILRRAGEFERAVEILAELDSTETPESAFILNRIEVEDDRCYTLEDVANFEREGSNWRPPLIGIVTTRRGRIRLGVFSLCALAIVLFEHPIILWLGLAGLGLCFVDMVLVTLTQRVP